MLNFISHQEMQMKSIYKLAIYSPERLEGKQKIMPSVDKDGENQSSYSLLTGIQIIQLWETVWHHMGKLDIYF